MTQPDLCSHHSRFIRTIAARPSGPYLDLTAVSDMFHCALRWSSISR